MKFELLPLKPEDIPLFKRDLQEAFQQGATFEYSNLDEQVLPEQDIDASLSEKGSVAYVAMEDDRIVGGVIVVINEVTQHNRLDFLYVKHGLQSRGTGRRIWEQVEQLHGNTKSWETVTPYFDKRNVHFYINRCGFSAVEFYNPYHKDPRDSGDAVGEDSLFRLVKVMKI